MQIEEMTTHNSNDYEQKGSVNCQLNSSLQYWIEIRPLPQVPDFGHLPWTARKRLRLKNWHNNVRDRQNNEFFQNFTEIDFK